MASITTFFGSQGGGGSVSGAPGQVCFFDSSSSAVGSDLLYWDAFSDRLSVGDPTTVPSTVTIAGAGASDATSSLEVRTDGSYGDLLLFRVYNNGRIDSRMLSSTEALTNNVAFGINAGSSITTGLGNTSVGAFSLTLLTQGNNNSSFGAASLDKVTTGSSNSAFGASSLPLIQAANYNSGFGAQTLQLNISGENNTAAGYAALNSTTSSDNSAFGANSMIANSTGERNSAHGSNSLASNQTTSDNAAAGYRSLGAVGGGGNTAIGSYSGYYRGGGFSLNTTCTNCVYIGFESRASAVGVNNEIVIGHGAVGGGSNTVTIGNTSITDTIIRGNLLLSDPSDITIGGTTGTKIGTAASQKLAFYGDTPIVQPTTAVASATAVHGSGTAVKEDSTFGGYTIGQVVTALQTLGLLA